MIFMYLWISHTSGFFLSRLVHVSTVYFLQKVWSLQNSSHFQVKEIHSKNSLQKIWPRHLYFKKNCSFEYTSICLESNIFPISNSFMLLRRQKVSYIRSTAESLAYNHSLLFFLCMSISTLLQEICAQIIWCCVLHVMLSEFLPCSII
jgi:hypothetical protein